MVCLDDDWGVLEVDVNVWIDQQVKIVMVLVVDIDLFKFCGCGWKFMLKLGWIVIFGICKGDLVVKCSVSF